MFLLVTATEKEMNPLRKLLHNSEGLDFLISGLGPVETVFSLTQYLTAQKDKVKTLINFGVAGAFPDTGLELLDICLAEKEVFGDIGICFGDRVVDFESGPMSRNIRFEMDNALLAKTEKVLAHALIPYNKGTFVTVNCVSGTARRGRFLQEKHGAICENMEGAAVARVCQEYGLPVLEVRCVSNHVEDRDVSKWNLQESCRNCAEIVVKIVNGLSSS